MAQLSLAYLGALLRVAPTADLARAVVRRVKLPSRPPPLPRPDEIREVAERLLRAPRLFSADDPVPLYERYFPEALPRQRQRAERILDGEAEIFGRWRKPDLDCTDPKLAWEAARAGHLVELAAATRLHPSLAGEARRRIAAELHAFLDAGRPQPPLEVSVRGLHWLAALELAGGVGRFSGALRQRLAGAFLQEGHFLSANLEDGGVCPANHLLGDWVGLLMRGLVTGWASWLRRAARGVRVEAERQVGSDGSHFEASTSYHRFALELIFIAERLAHLGLGEVLRRMIGYVRGYLTPDGCEPGFGDGDDAHLLPVVPRAPRDHAYLVGLGAALYGEPRLGLPEEVIWWGGARGVSAWQAAPPAVMAPAASFPQGGVHVLRSPRLYVGLRAGSYGQHGVGGHAHNDQLSLVIYAGGRALIVDAGTASYTADPVARERFRGTAAHSTVIVDGMEQSPVFEGRPFALPDRARTTPVHVEDLGPLAAMSATHHGYGRVRHTRRVTLYRELDALLIEDELDGEGIVPVEVRFHLMEAARVGPSPELRARVAALDGRIGPLDVENAFHFHGAALVPRAQNLLSPRVARGWCAPHFGAILQVGVVSYAGLLSLPQTATVAVIYLP